MYHPLGIPLLTGIEEEPNKIGVYLPISSIPSMMRMIQRYSGSVKGDRASDGFSLPCTLAFLIALIRVVIRFDCAGLPQ